MNRCIRMFALLFAATSLHTAAAYAQSCHCEVSATKQQAYNTLLNLAPAEQQQAALVHMPWGAPTPAADASHEHALYQEDYIIDYDDDLRVPL